MRMTREKDEWECRVNGCHVEEWLDAMEVDTNDIYYCENCPMMPYVNRLAEYEDKYGSEL